MSRKEEIELLIQESFIKHGGFFYTKHARVRMIERNIRRSDIDYAYQNGEIHRIEIDSQDEIKVIWEGKDLSKETIRMVLVYSFDLRTFVITVIGDIYEN